MDVHALTTVSEAICSHIETTLPNSRSLCAVHVGVLVRAGKSNRDGRNIMYKRLQKSSMKEIREKNLMSWRNNEHAIRLQKWVWEQCHHASAVFKCTALENFHWTVTKRHKYFALSGIRNPWCYGFPGGLHVPGKPCSPSLRDLWKWRPSSHTCAPHTLPDLFGAQSSACLQERGSQPFKPKLSGFSERFPTGFQIPPYVLADNKPAQSTWTSRRLLYMGQPR